MANTKKSDAPALPALDGIASVEASTLTATKRAALNEAETAVADAIIAAASGTNAARGPKSADRKIAASAAARMKRLVIARFKTNGTAEADRPTVKSGVVPFDGGYAWMIKLVAAAPVEADAGDDTDNPLIPAAE
jgi:hypothetical protein